MSAAQTGKCPTRAALLASVRAALSDIWADPVLVQSIFTEEMIDRARARRIERRLSRQVSRQTSRRNTGGAL